MSIPVPEENPNASIAFRLGRYAGLLEAEESILSMLDAVLNRHGTARTTEP